MRTSIALVASLLLLVACTDDGRVPACPESGCVGTSDGPGPIDNSEAGPSCGRYLSCLLLTSPEAYGAAITIYGKDAACWETAQQTAGCNQACDAAFARIADQCECTGTTCTRCNALSGTYHRSADVVGTCSDFFFPSSVELTPVGAELEVEVYIGGQRLVDRVLRPCDGPLTIGDGSGAECNGYTVVVTPEDGGARLKVQVTLSSTSSACENCQSTAYYDR